MVKSDKEHQIPFNCFRVFFPAVKGETHTTCNRIYKLDSAKYAVEMVGRSLLSNYMLNCHEGGEDVEKIGHLITLAKLRSHKAAHLELVRARQDERDESELDEKDKIISGLNSDIEAIWAEAAEEEVKHKQALEKQNQECKRHQKRAEDLTRQLAEVRHCIARCKGTDGSAPYSCHISQHPAFLLVDIPPRTRQHFCVMREHR